MKIAVDAMGGDLGPSAVIEGISMALNLRPEIQKIFVVGRKDDLDPLLTRFGIARSAKVELIPATQVLAMDDKPVQALRQKKDCSLLRAMDVVKAGDAQAVISLGNTGGILAAATLRLRKLPGVDRPGIATIIPTRKRHFILIDSGASIDSRPFHLVHHAIMGSVYSRLILKVPFPRIGLLNVGTEEEKGNELARCTYELLKKTPLNFIGNVEGYDPFKNRVDVVVCDGFVGNILLKSMEGITREVFNLLKHELTANPKRKMGALLARDAFLTIKRRMNPDEQGGAPMLGVNGLCFKAHGSSSAIAVRSAIRVAADAIKLDINQQIVEEVSKANDILEQKNNAHTCAEKVG